MKVIPEKRLFTQKLGQAQEYGVVKSVNNLEPELFLTINVHIFFLDVITRCKCIVIVID
jgi:hypothetical protein